MATKNTYQLINPYVEGTVPTVVQARNSFSAGKKLYTSLSNHFTNHLEKFYMTIKNVETNDLTHFKVDEIRNSNGLVNFNLTNLDSNFSDEIEKKISSTINQMSKQSGGGILDDDDDSDSDSSSSLSPSEYYVPSQPITKYVYYHLPYYRLDLVGFPKYEVDRIFVPTFSLPINPCIEINMKLYQKNFTL